MGSFILYLDGEPQIVDAGNLVYTAKTFGPERYTLWNTRSRNHNVPLVGEVEQREGREYAAQVVEADESGAVLQLAAAYPREAELESLVRAFALAQEGMRVTDRVNLIREQTMTWVFLLAHAPRWDAQGRVVRAGPIALRVPTGARYEAQEIPIADGRMRRSFETLWRVALTYGPGRVYDMTFEVTRS